MIVRKVKYGLCGVFAGLLLTGCEGDSRQALVSAPVEPSATLATVDDSIITRDQLELTIERTLGDSAPLFASAEVERKILESLVSSRAMALLAERELSPSERAQLDLKAQAYREELLVRHYLEAHATPEPITTEQVADYYNRHPDEFGGGVERSFETISSSQVLEEPQRSELITLLSGHRCRKTTGRRWWWPGAKRENRSNTGRTASSRRCWSSRCVVWSNRLRWGDRPVARRWPIGAGTCHRRAALAGQTPGGSQQCDTRETGAAGAQAGGEKPEYPGFAGSERAVQLALDERVTQCSAAWLTIKGSGRAACI